MEFIAGGTNLVDLMKYNVERPERLVDINAIALREIADAPGGGLRIGGALDNYAFPSRIDHTAHVSTRQYARLVDEWILGIGLHAEDNGTHSLRRTKASIIYKRTSKLRAVQILLGHTKIERTVRYLGVNIDDALTLAESTEL